MSHAGPSARTSPTTTRSPAQTIRSTKLYHRQVYSFAYHRRKLALLRENQQQKRFAPLADFLEHVPEICPHDLFRESSRASQLPDFVVRNHLIVVEKENFATRTATLIIPSVGNNRLRHETLQRFMLANDSVTIAVEIPIWLTPADIDALEVEHGIRLVPDGAPRILTGHIDFLQVRNGAIHILDYKPDARTNKPIAQLAKLPCPFRLACLPTCAAGRPRASRETISWSGTGNRFSQ